MTPLPSFLAKIHQIPKEEFALGKPIQERPHEMSLLAEIISDDEITKIRNAAINITRRCDFSDNKPFIHFRIVNGSTHNIVATLTNSTEVVVQDNKATINISSIEELHDYIWKLVELQEK